MVFSKSSSSSSSSKLRNPLSEKGSDASMADLARKIVQLKKKIQSERVASVGEKIERNRQSVESYVSNLETLASTRAVNSETNLMSLRMQNPVCKMKGVAQTSSDTDNVEGDEIVFCPTAKLPPIEKIPPYTTWMFLDKNQRMAEDQSVVGRRRIYYDQHGSEALICSDSEEEPGEIEGADKHEFSEGEDRILRLALEECSEISDEVIGVLTQFVRATPSEIKERCRVLMLKDREIENEKSEKDSFLDKSLSSALDSFDNLFCRRCLVFDCRLHGCSQNLVYPKEKQPYACSSDEERKPCGKHCYLLTNGSKDLKETLHVASDKEQDKNLENKEESVITEPSVSLLDVDTAALVVDESKESITETEDPLHKVEDRGKRIVDSPFIEECNRDGESIKAPKKPREWRNMEKDLYLKGLEIFGRNSCLIARNLLGDLRTCKEVFNYMCGDKKEANMNRSSAISSSFHDNDGRTDLALMDVDAPEKSRVCRKRGRARKVKSSWKSAGHPSLWRRVADGKDPSCKQYNPCGCESQCGKDCSCLKYGLCCEKYCGFFSPNSVQFILPFR